ncbi:MAG: thioredoxin family protein [Armatimonadota bacterium]
MAKPIDVEGANFHTEVLKFDETPVLVDFWSPSCGHCLALNPHFEQLAAERDGQVRFAKVSYADNSDLFRDYNVRATPTLVLFRAGEEIARTVGAKRAEELDEWLQQNLAD